jgi:hypothetical protein
MSHLGDIASILTAIGLLLTGCSSAFNIFLTWRNGKKAEKIVGAINVIKEQTDGISAKLVKVTGEAEHAKGMLQGAAEAHGK